MALKLYGQQNHSKKTGLQCWNPAFILCDGGGAALPPMAIFPYLMTAICVKGSPVVAVSPCEA